MGNNIPNVNKFGYPLKAEQAFKIKRLDSLKFRGFKANYPHKNLFKYPGLSG